MAAVKAGGRHSNGDPPMHANKKHAREYLQQTTLSLVMTFHLDRQDRYTEQGREQYSDNPRYEHLVENSR